MFDNEIFSENDLDDGIVRIELVEIEIDYYLLIE